MKEQEIREGIALIIETNEAPTDKSDKRKRVDPDVMDFIKKAAIQALKPSEVDFPNIIAFELKKRGMSQVRMAQEMGMNRMTLSERLQIPLMQWRHEEILNAANVLDINHIFLLYREEDLQKRLAKRRATADFIED